MRNYRYRIQTNQFALFAGVTAHVTHHDTPPTNAIQISDRVWMDVSHIQDGFQHTPLTLTGEAIEALTLGLHKVASRIEAADQHPHITITVDALEISPTDYIDAALAPAVAGWAAEEFQFARPNVTVRLDRPNPQYTFNWES
jgi:hypothetical protein